RRFLIVDAAMNDFLRPALYNAKHNVIPVSAPAQVAQGAQGVKGAPADVVGPVCETGDVLASGQNLPDMAPDALLAIESAGAYGAVMSSTYNTRLPVAEVMVNGDQFFVVRPRPDYDSLLSLDRMPGWLEQSGISRSRGVA
ncbi:MAG: hypothetical protein ACTSQV_05455, partial [Alphaproteobacteria bacterium]